MMQHYRMYLLLANFCRKFFCPWFSYWYCTVLIINLSGYLQFMFSIINSAKSFSICVLFFYHYLFILRIFFRRFLLRESIIVILRSNCVNCSFFLGPDHLELFSQLSYFLISIFSVLQISAFFIITFSSEFCWILALYYFVSNFWLNFGSSTISKHLKILKIVFLLKDISYLPYLFRV